MVHHCFSKLLPPYNHTIIRKESGLTLLEVIAVLFISGILVIGLSNIVTGALNQFSYNQERNELLYQGSFAMDRIINAVARTRRLLVPLAENPATAHSEASRDVLAVTIDPTLDSNGDNFADADNDKDGLIDEDIPSDNTNDGAAGIVGIDDDGDGLIDEGNDIRNNDEEGARNDDWINNVDDDGDGSIDEDIPRKNTSFNRGAAVYDNDGDGLNSEDWLDPAVYFVNTEGTALIERLPNANAADGTDYTERPIAEADNVSFTVERFVQGEDDRGVLLAITLQLMDDVGGTVTLESVVQVGL